jgi:hypothetical protein
MLCHYAECRILFIMPNVVMLSVVAPVINENLNKLQFRFAPLVDAGNTKG